MPIPWVAIGALSSFGSFIFTVLESDARDEGILQYLGQLDGKVNEIIQNQSHMIAMLNRLPKMVERAVHTALVDQSYSHIRSHFSSYMSLNTRFKRKAYIRKNVERIRELFEYVVDYETRIDGQLKLISASESVYVMLRSDKDGMLLMKNTFQRKIDEVKDFVEDMEQSLINRDNELSGRLLKHRYISSHNYTPPMDPAKLRIVWQESWVRDCISPGEPDFLFRVDALDKSTWYCAPPNIAIEGTEFRNRFNRVRAKLNEAIDSSVVDAQNYESHRELIEKVYRPYIVKIEAHIKSYESLDAFS